MRADFALKVTAAFIGHFPDVNAWPLVDCRFEIERPALGTLFLW